MNDSCRFHDQEMRESKERPSRLQGPRLGADALVQVWAVPSSKKLAGAGAEWRTAASFHAGGGALAAAAWSPDGARIATVGEDGLANVWAACPERGAEAWALAAALPGHAAGACSVAWCPDGARLLTGAADRTARIWDPSRHEEALLQLPA
ncbi:unnamed protein product [Prorocentrum cordatum]|uniref:Uncharacterized protein n=1 Tax=Prorocentrum cordatum TaxID=2364126 RepID=A0ABN9PLE2_9DINO|nr:unnamed protein product [Polarella glacialis]